MLKELGGTLFSESAVRRLNPDYSTDNQRICTIFVAATYWPMEGKTDS